MLLNKPDIVSVVESHVELKKKGRYFWALCPLPGHLEKTPSFKVDPERQFFYCFGCGSGGDVISFIQKYKDLSFQESVRYLGINGKTYRPEPKEIKKRELIKAFRAWCDDYFEDLCSLVRCLYKATQNCKTIEDAEKLAEFYHLEPIWWHRIEILLGDDDEAKFKLYKKVLHE